MNDTLDMKGVPEPRSSKCTFEIKILNSQNATWQGHVHWIETDRKQYFRSVLELLTLMDEALSETEGVTYPVSWVSD